MSFVAAYRSRRRTARLLVLGGLAVVLTVSAACQPVKGGTPPRILLMGDSIAHSIEPSLRYGFSANGRAFDTVAQPGCGLLRGIVQNFPQDTNGDGIADQASVDWPFAAGCDKVIYQAHEEALQRSRPDVVISADVFAVFPRRVDECPCPAPYPALLADCPVFVAGCTDPLGIAQQKLLQLLEEQRQHIAAYGAKWVILTIPPAWNDFRDSRHLRVQHLNNIYRQFASQHEDVGILELEIWACPSTPNCSQFVDGVDLRPDGIHFGGAGAGWVAQRVVPSVIDAFGG